MFTKNTMPAKHSVVVNIRAYIAKVVKVVGLSIATSPTPYEHKAGDYMLCLMDNNVVPTIRDLYPNLSENELAIAEDNLEQYLLLMLRIYERIQADPESYARFRALTEQIHGVSLKSSRSDRLSDANSNH